IKCGSILEFNSRIDFYDTAMNEGGFDAKYYYRTRKVTAKAEPGKIEITGQKNSADAVLNRILFSMRRYVKSNLLQAFGDEDGGVLISLITGDRTLLDTDIKEMYRDTGFAHVLAVSGLHISLICLSLFRLLTRKLKKIWAAFFTLSFIGIYTAFTGMQVSCIRAGIMLSFMLFAICMGRKYDPLSAISGAAIIILLKQPLYIYDASFLMSFAAGFGIIFVKSASENTELLIENERVKKAVKALLFTIGLQLFILPVQLDFFYGFCPYSFILNILLLPFMSVLVVSGIVSAILPFTQEILLWIVSFPAKAVLRLYETVLKAVGHLPANRVVTGRLNIYEHIIVVLCFILFIVVLMKFRHVLSYMMFFPLIILLRKPYCDVPVFNQLYVGQGDCAVVFYMDKVILIDCGSSDEYQVYGYTVEKFLNYYGYTGPDYIFLSHGDADHVSGVVEMLGGNGEDDGLYEFDQSRSSDSNAYGTGMEESQYNQNNIAYDSYTENIIIFIPKLDDESGFENVISAADAGGVKIRRLSTFERFSIGNLSFLMIYPGEEDNSITENESSMVLYVKYEAENDFKEVSDSTDTSEGYIYKYDNDENEGGCSEDNEGGCSVDNARIMEENQSFDALFTGDIGEEAEAKIVSLMEAHPYLFPETFDFLKVAHHGSRYSSSDLFLNAVSPELAVSSAGKDNTYNHPSQDTIERLKNHEIDHLCTKDYGRIRVIWQKGEIEVSRYRE
ncbi:MAG: ComEC/Rec2 family competence protein, partial [Lachnospiraceae bacterium]|nr:ComEC/Rec2 family competence protein [Lachnospiraceae bacterium]